MTPSGVIFPTLLPYSSVNHRLPSGPETMEFGLLLAVGTFHSVTLPSRLIRPIRSPIHSVNQTLPSGPAVMPEDPTKGVGSGYSVIRLAAWAGEAGMANATAAMATSNATRPGRTTPSTCLTIRGR